MFWRTFKIFLIYPITHYKKFKSFLEMNEITWPGFQFVYLFILDFWIISKFQASLLKHHLHIWATKLPLGSHLVLGFSIISYCPNNKTINNHLNFISDKKQIGFTGLPCFSLSCDIRIEHYSGWRQYQWISFPHFFLPVFKRAEEPYLLLVA